MSYFSWIVNLGRLYFGEVKHGGYRYLFRLRCWRYRRADRAPGLLKKVTHSDQCNYYTPGPKFHYITGHAACQVDSRRRAFFANGVTDRRKVMDRRLGPDEEMARKTSTCLYFHFCRSRYSGWVVLFALVYLYISYLLVYVRFVIHNSFT